MRVSRCLKCYHQNGSISWRNIMLKMYEVMWHFDGRTWSYVVVYRERKK